MRNYVTINGVDSTSLAGFLIQELPPLSLPKMRTKTETIDGRDGDIITKLGYSAYDKEITIGLYGSYDIDKINEFFVSEGTIVFSNEPDKYYRFTMVDGIDYDRLVRFRTGKITFHCQPYKYDATETEIDFTNTFTEDTEPYIFRANQHDANMMKLKKVVGGTIAWNQEISNGNFESTTGWKSQNVGSTLSVADGVATITHNGTSELSPYNPALGFASGYAASGYAPSGVIGHVYYIYMEVKSPITQFVYFGGNPTELLPAYAPVTANTWTKVQILRKVTSLTTEGTLFGYLGLYRQTGFPSGGELQFRNINIYDLTQMFGSTIADYIASLEQAHAGDGVAWFKALFPKAYYPYNSGELLSVKTSARKTYNADNVEIGSYPLDSDLELRGIPKLDSNNELYYDGDTYESDGTVTRRYGVIDLGTLNWTWYSQYKFYLTTGLGKKAGIINLLSSAFVTKAGSWTGADPTENIVWGNGSNNTVYIQTTTSYADATAFKTAMSGVYLVYELATPTTESADAYTQSQRVGATEEFVDGRTVEIPVGNESEYYDGTPEIVVKNKGNTTSRPTLTIYGEGTITVSLNGDEIFTITMGDHEYITIDTEEMNAYMGGVLLNRSVTGDYSSFVLNAGDNTISLSGNVSEVLIDNYSRWL